MFFGIKNLKIKHMKNKALPVTLFSVSILLVWYRYWYFGITNFGVETLLRLYLSCCCFFILPR